MAKKAIVGPCKFCDREKLLIEKSHIIPKCFQKPLKNDRNEMTVIDPERRKRPPVQDFFFEGNILCSDCDNMFGKDEDYTARFFNKYRNDSIIPIREVPNPFGKFIFYNIDTMRIKKCLLSILWRMSISNRTEFKHINLGKLELRLKNGLKTDDFTKETFFPVQIGTTKHINDIKARFLKVPNKSIKLKTGNSYAFGHAMLLPDIVILFYATSFFSGDTTFIGLKKNQPLLLNYANQKMTMNFLQGIMKDIGDAPCSF